MTFSQSNIKHLPGFDNRKTTLLGILNVMFICFLFGNDIPEVYSDGSLKIIKIITLILHATSIVFIILLYAIVEIIRNTKKYRRDKIYYPKYIIIFATYLFYISLVIWIFALGGLFLSPFASLLSISPVILLLQNKQDEKNYTAVTKLIKSNKKLTEQDKQMLVERHETQISKLKILTAIPFWITLFIITIFFLIFVYEFAFIRDNAEQHCINTICPKYLTLLTGINIPELIKSKWYAITETLVYLVTVVATIFYTSRIYDNMLSKKS